MERLAIISHNFFRANGSHKSRSPSSPYGPAPQGGQLITLDSIIDPAQRAESVKRSDPQKRRKLNQKKY